MLTETDKAELRAIEDGTFSETPWLEADHQTLLKALGQLHGQVAFLLNLRRLQDEVNAGRDELVKATLFANARLRERNAKAERDLAQANSRIAELEERLMPTPPRLAEGEHNTYPNGRWTPK